MWLLPQVMLLCGVLLVAEAILAMGASHAVSIKDLAGVSGGTLVPRVAGVSRAALFLGADGVSGVTFSWVPLVSWVSLLS